MSTLDDQSAAGDPSASVETTFQTNVLGKGSAQAHQLRQARSLRHSEYFPVPLYVRTGDRLEILVAGLVLGNLFAVVGVPSLDMPDIPAELALSLGQNVIIAAHAGLLSFINRNEFGGINVSVVVKGPQRAHLPFFQLGVHDNSDWFAQMHAYPEAPVVALTSKRAIIVVRYHSAEVHLRDPVELMLTFDRFIAAQDAISGIGDPTLEDCKLDPNKLLYIEADNGYMFAANGFMGFKGDYAMQALLSNNLAHAWGPWHESGHQRQLSAMSWGKGSGMVETMVNLYSLAAQEALEGRASRLDENYPAVKAYLQQSHRDYDALNDHFLKLAMLWQLNLVFGRVFYPQLHQMYRRLPEPVKEAEKKQKFIRETSLLAGIDLTPFFDRWGVYATSHTLASLEHLPLLTEPLWETDDTHVISLPLPQPDYLPVLAYLEANMSLPSMTGTSFLLRLTPKWLRPYRYEISVDGQAVASVDNGVGEHCAVVEGDTFAQITVPVALGPKGKVEVHAVLEGNRHRILVGGRSHSSLASRLDALFVDADCTVIKPGTTQDDITRLFTDLNRSAVDERMFERFHRAQMLLLKTTVHFMALSHAAISVFLIDDAFRQYDYELIGDQTIASLVHGVPQLSTLAGHVWKFQGAYDHDKDMRVCVTMNGGHRYVLFSADYAENGMIHLVRSLFTNDKMTALKPGVGQESIDSRRFEIAGSFKLSRHGRALSLQYLDIAQALIFRTTIDRVETSDGINVHFADDQFKRETYHLFLNGVYISEIAKGYPAYSGLNGRHWRTDASVGDQDIWVIYALYNQEWYPVMSNAGSGGIRSAAASPEADFITQCGVGPNAPCSGQRHA